MNFTLGLVLYIMIWWMTLFVVLPFGVKTQGEAGEVVPGTPESAPARQRMLRVFLINTVVSAVAFVLVWEGLQHDWLRLNVNVPLPPSAPTL